MLERTRAWYRERGAACAWLELYGAYRISGAIAGNFYENPLTSWGSYGSMVVDLGRKAYELVGVLPVEAAWYGIKGLIDGTTTVFVHPFTGDAWRQLGHTLGSLHTMHNYDHGELAGTGFQKMMDGLGPLASASSEVRNVGMGLAALGLCYLWRQHKRTSAVNVNDDSLERKVLDASSF